MSTIPEQESESDATPVYVYCADGVVSQSEAQSLLSMEKSKSHVPVDRSSSAEEIDEIDNDSALRQNSHQVTSFTNIWSQQYAYANVPVIAGLEINRSSLKTTSDDSDANQPNSSEDTWQVLEKELGMEETKQPAQPVMMNKIANHLVNLYSNKKSIRPVLLKTLSGGCSIESAFEQIKGITSTLN